MMAPRLEQGKATASGVTCGSHSAQRTYQVIHVVDDLRGAPDHKHTYIHVLSYGHVITGWLLSSLFTRKTGESSNGFIPASV